MSSCVMMFYDTLRYSSHHSCTSTPGDAVEWCMEPSHHACQSSQLASYAPAIPFASSLDEPSCCCLIYTYGDGVAISRLARFASSVQSSSFVRSSARPCCGTSASRSRQSSRAEPRPMPMAAIAR